MIIGTVESAGSTDSAEGRAAWPTTEPITGAPMVMIALVVGAALLTACSGSFSFGTSEDDRFLTAGENLIETELADQIGLGPLEASCTGTDLVAGDTFECRATAGSLDPIRFIGTVAENEEEVNLSTTNLLLADQVEQVEAFSASLIADETAVAIGPEHFECGNGSIIIENGEVLDCFLTDPTDGTVYEAPVTVEDLDSMSVVVNVGDPVG